MNDNYDFLCDAEPSQPVPDGTYVVRALNAETSETKTGGQRVKVRFSIVGGDFDGRTLYGSFLVSHPNRAENYQNAVRIGKKHFADLALAAGVCHKNWPNISQRAKDMVEKGKAVVVDRFSGNFSEILGKTLVGKWVTRGKYSEPAGFSTLDAAGISTTPSAPAPYSEYSTSLDNVPF